MQREIAEEIGCLPAKLVYDGTFFIHSKGYQWLGSLFVTKID